MLEKHELSTTQRTVVVHQQRSLPTLPPNPVYIRYSSHQEVASISPLGNKMQWKWWYAVLGLVLNKPRNFWFCCVTENHDVQKSKPSFERQAKKIEKPWLIKKKKKKTGKNKWGISSKSQHLSHLRSSRPIPIISVSVLWTTARCSLLKFLTPQLRAIKELRF